ncbi:MAG: hypothetical protein FJ304_24645 [Planctomycetes bacterium]|nr:hypothetical protein [Planctomycetota bacterium]
MRCCLALLGIGTVLLMPDECVRADDKPVQQEFRKITPPGGAPLVLWIGPMRTKLNEDALRGPAKRLEAAPKEELAKWVRELERITDKKLGSEDAKAECLTWFVTRMSVAFGAGHKWNAKAAGDLFRRAQSMPASDAKAWREAFEGVMKTKIENAYEVPLVLIPVDALHENHKYSADRAQKYQARLKQLTGEDLSLWVLNADEFGGGGLDAAVNIVLLDGFFEKELFQRDKFKAAVAPAKK